MTSTTPAIPTPNALPSQRETITLGGGCFWCTEAVFVAVRGVTDVESGYCNGQAARPTYDDVCTGRTGCNEVVKLEFDPVQITAREILEIFFVIHDPTTLNAQGNDRGTQYRSGIYLTPGATFAAHQAMAQGIVVELTQANSFGRPVVTEVAELAHYWPAEDYHQDFFAKNPYQGYCVAVAAPKVAKFRKTFADKAL
jgi:peptide-methionine (S)-S-oxide reductase